MADTPASTDAGGLLPLLGNLPAKAVTRIDWSPDGSMIAVADDYGSITLMAPRTGDSVRTWTAHTGDVRDVAWSPVGRLLASCGNDGYVSMWDPSSGQLERRGRLRSVHRLAWSPDGSCLAAAQREGPTYVFDSRLTPLGVFGEDARAIAWHPESIAVAYCTADNKIKSYDMLTGETQYTFDTDLDDPLSIAWSKDNKWLAAGGMSGIVLFKIDGSSPPTTIESAAGHIGDLQFSPDGRLLVAAGSGGIEMWRREPWELVASIPGRIGSWASTGLSIRSDGSAIACTLETDRVMPNDRVRIWGVDPALLASVAAEESAFYVTVKVALLGDAGVGKTSLAFRMVSGEFQQHPSTHGQRFWVLPELAGKRQDGATCEAVLWDFAGQADYRIVHALLLDDVDVALLVFDPGNTTEPLKGVSYWHRQLGLHTTGNTRSVLVGAKMDRAGLTVSRTELESFCANNKIIGGYVGTSAASGAGVDHLMERIRSAIDWDGIRPTVTTATFKRVKDFVLRAKAEATQSEVVVVQDDLLDRLRTAEPGHTFESRDVAVAVSQLAKHGLVTPLQNVRGVDYVLLSPELLTGLASSIVLEVRRDVRELGTIDEKRLLAGEYPFPELADLTEEQWEILLDAAVELFIRHNLCFRETIGATSLLVFPALINQGVSATDRQAHEEDTTFVIEKASENVYAALVVLLGYTNALTRKGQWRGQAEYELDPGEVCGFRLVREVEGELEIVLYFAPETPPVSRQLFRSQVERIISRRKVGYTRIEQVRCVCGYIQDHGEVRKRIIDGRQFIYCSECGKRLPLTGVASAVDERVTRTVMADEREALRRTRYEAALTRLKALVRDRMGELEAPSCFISYAWGDVAEERRIGRLKDDLANAGLRVVYDRVDNAEIGSRASAGSSRVWMAATTSSSWVRPAT